VTHIPKTKTKQTYDEGSAVEEDNNREVLLVGDGVHVEVETIFTSFGKGAVSISVDVGLEQGIELEAFLGLLGAVDNIVLGACR
jgi:hypothetical protein